MQLNVVSDLDERHQACTLIRGDPATVEQCVEVDRVLAAVAGGLVEAGDGIGAVENVLVDQQAVSVAQGYRVGLLAPEDRVVPVAGGDHVEAETAGYVVVAGAAVERVVAVAAAGDDDVVAVPAAHGIGDGAAVDGVVAVAGADADGRLRLVREEVVAAAEENAGIPCRAVAEAPLHGNHVVAGGRRRVAAVGKELDAAVDAEIGIVVELDG